MSKVIFKNIMKVYPFSDSDRNKSRKRKQNVVNDEKANLVRTDKGVVAVNDFNLEIEDKEFVVLVGPSGCGKSTTLRMVAGLEEITQGELYIGDRLVNNLPPKDRDIAMVFQNYALYPHMTVYENMAFALKLAKRPMAEIDAKVREAAEILDITGYLNRKPKALSGGQRQRVAIGRAIVRNPQVFLMDEPLSNLDAKLRNQMRAEIIKLRQRINTTFIYVTHDQTEAITLGDRIVIMKDGFIQQIGTPQMVFNRPINLFVAGFIGSPQMNFFDADLVRAGSDRYEIVYCGKAFPLPEDSCAQLAEKGVTSCAITLGIRPEHIRLVEDGEGVEAVLDVLEMMGSELYLHVLSGGTSAIVRVQIATLPEKYRGSIPHGEKLSINFAGSFMHLFDKQTEMNLL